MGQPAMAMAADVPLLEEAYGGKLPPPQAGYRPADGPSRQLGAELATAALSLRDRGFYNPPQQLRRRAQAECALEWLVNFVALTEPELLPTLGLPEQWVRFMLEQHDDQQLEAQRMVHLARLATPERLAMLARGRAAAMLYDAVTPQDWYFASRALGHLPKWVLGEVAEQELLAEEEERRKEAKAQGSSLKAQVEDEVQGPGAEGQGEDNVQGSSGKVQGEDKAQGTSLKTQVGKGDGEGAEEVRLNRAARRRLEKLQAKQG